MVPSRSGEGLKLKAIESALVDASKRPSTSSQEEGLSDQQQQTLGSGGSKGKKKKSAREDTALLLLRERFPAQVRAQEARMDGLTRMQVQLVAGLMRRHRVGRGKRRAAGEDSSSSPPPTLQVQLPLREIPVIPSAAAYILSLVLDQGFQVGCTLHRITTYSMKTYPPTNIILHTPTRLPQYQRSTTPIVPRRRVSLSFVPPAGCFP